MARPIQREPSLSLPTVLIRTFPYRGKALEHEIGVIASAQLGLITRQQLLKVGLTPKMIRYRLSTSRLDLVHAGVYRIAGAPTSFEQQLLAAVLGAKGGVVSHLAAAHVHRLEGLRTKTPEITIPHGRRVRIEGVVVHRSRDLGSHDFFRMGPLLVTTPARTLVDLSPLLPLSVLERAMNDARLRKLTTLAELREAIARRAKPGVGSVTSLRVLVRLRDGSFWRQMSHALLPVDPPEVTL